MSNQKGITGSSDQFCQAVQDFAEAQGWLDSVPDVLMPYINFERFGKDAVGENNLRAVCDADGSLQLTWG